MPVRRSAAVIPILVLLLALLGAVLARPAEVAGQANYVWSGNELTLTLGAAIAQSSSSPQTMRYCGSWGEPLPLFNTDPALVLDYVCGSPLSNSSADGVHFLDEADAETIKGWDEEGFFATLEWGTDSDDDDFYGGVNPPFLSGGTGNIRAESVSGESTFALNWNPGSSGPGLGAVTLLKVTFGSNLLSTGTPSTPEMVSVTRSLDFTSATISWNLYDPVAEYEIQREAATTVTVGDISRIEYGNPTAFTVEGTLEGVDTYSDDTVEADKTYQYRVRAMGAEWGPWSSWVFVSADPSRMKLDEPANLQLERATDNSQVVISWTAPSDAVDNYTLQREEFVDGIFANVMSFSASGSDWLPGDSTTYTDSAILPGRTYRYRVAAVRDDVVGEYSDWASSGPIDLTFGLPPMSLHVGDDQRHDDRREYWMVWDAVDGADDYELEINVFDLHAGTLTMEDDVVVRDPTYFATAFERKEYRVRGRKQDADLCGSGADDYCYTDWTGWFSVPFVPVVVEPSPPVLTTPVAPRADVMAARTALEGFVEGVVEPSGFTVDPGDVIDLAVLVLGLVGAGGAFLKSHRSGMAPLGVGAGVAWFILVLVLGILLVDLPVIWAVVSLVVVLVLGILALVMSLGLGRGE